MDHNSPIAKSFTYITQQKCQIIGNNFMTGLKTKMQQPLLFHAHTMEEQVIWKVSHEKHGFPLSHENKKFNNSSNKNMCIQYGKNGYIVEVCY